MIQSKEEALAIMHDLYRNTWEREEAIHYLRKQTLNEHEIEALVEQLRDTAAGVRWAAGSALAAAGQDQAMGQRGHHQIAQIVRDAVVASFGQRAGLCGAVPRLKTARRNAQLKKRRPTRFGDDAFGVVHQRFVDAHQGHGVLQGQDLFGGDDGLQIFDGVVLAAAGDDAPFVVARRIPQPQPQQEAVHLRLGQRVGAEVLKWVLRRHHQKRLLQGVRVVVDGHAPFAHRFEQAGLRPRRGAVDLVRQDDVRKDGAGLELKDACLVVPQRHTDDVRWQQVGCELDAAEYPTNRPCQRACDGGFADAGDVFEQHVTPRCQRHDGQPDDFGLAVDDAVHVLHQACAERESSFGRHGRSGVSCAGGWAGERAHWIAVQTHRLYMHPLG